jgi:hypothetical protein
MDSSKFNADLQLESIKSEAARKLTIASHRLSDQSAYQHQWSTISGTEPVSSERARYRQSRHNVNSLILTKASSKDQPNLRFMQTIVPKSSYERARDMNTIQIRKTKTQAKKRNQEIISDQF